MVNNNSQEEQFWYPQLPDGYDGSDDVKHGGPIPMPNTSEYFTGFDDPSYSMPGTAFSAYDGDHVMQRFSPGRGGPSQGWPGFPPGQGGPSQGWPGFPGQGGPSQGWPGFPGFPGQGGFPPGHNRPPHGSPGFPPGHGQQPGRPPGQHTGNQAPQTAPPSWTPEYPTHQLFAVDPGAIRGCLFRFTYIWLSRRQGFWFYPVFVGRTSVAGYRWNTRRRRWEYTGLDLENINSFTCV